MHKIAQRSRLVARLLITCLLIIVLSSGSMQPMVQAAAPAAIGNLYLALGDSLAVGSLSSMPDTRGYVARLHALLEQSAGHPIMLRNLAVSGETTRTMINGGQLTAAQKALSDAQAAGWQVSPITLDIGGNNIRLLQGSDTATRERGLTDFRSSLAQILDTLITASTSNGTRQANIVVMNIYNPYGGDPQIANSDAWWVNRFNTALSEEVTKRSLTVADAYSRFLNHERELTWMPIDIHANNAGHLVLAEACWQALGYDTIAPTLTVIAPTAGPLAKDILTIKLRATDQIGVTQVEFQINDQRLPPPRYNRELDLWIGYWNARTAPPGPYRLVITATDAGGTVATQTIDLTR